MSPSAFLTLFRRISLFLLVWAGLGPEALHAQAVNASNSFAGRQSIAPQSTNVSLSFNLANATAETNENAHCGYAAAQSVWFRWTPQVSGVVQIDTLGSTVGTRLAIYTGSAFPLTLVAQNQTDAALSSNETGYGSMVRFRTVAGTNYSICIDADEIGAYPLLDGVVLRLRTTATEIGSPPSNDIATGATPLEENGSSIGILDSTASATVDAADVVTAAYGVAYSVWYSWTCTTTKKYTASLSPEPDGDWSPVLAVYQKAPASANYTLLDLGETESNSPNTYDDFYVSSTFQGQAGYSYRFMVGSLAVSSKSGEFNLNLQEASSATNDNIASAIDLGSVTEAKSLSTLIGSTVESGERNHWLAFGSTTRTSSTSVWWKWTAATRGTVTVDTRGSNGDTVLFVYQGQPTSTTAAVAFNDDIISYVDETTPFALQSVTTFQATAGTAYYFCASGYTQGTVVFHLATGAVRDPYQAWLLDYLSLTEKGETDDPDGDGFSNLMEMAMGTDPTITEYSLATLIAEVPFYESTQGALVCSYDPLALLGLGSTETANFPVQVTFQQSIDGQSWSNLEAEKILRGTDSIEASIPTNSTQHYIRMKVTDPN